MPRKPVPPLISGWVIVDGLPVFHRSYLDAGPAADAMVHVHGFGISGTYLEPTAALLASRYRTFVPDLPGMGRSMRPAGGLDLPGLAKAVMSYCDAVGVERPILVGNSLGCPIIVEVATTFPDRIQRAVLVSPAGGPNNQPLARAIGQMAKDGLREPPSMLPIATRDSSMSEDLPAVEGLAGIVNDQHLVVLPNYIYAFDLTLWGWLHLLVGLALLAIGIFLIRGQTWARVAGMILAGISAILNFVWLPYSPWWALLIIGIDILVIWALANYHRQPAPQGARAAA